MNRTKRIIALLIASATGAGVLWFWPGCAHSPLARAAKPVARAVASSPVPESRPTAKPDEAAGAENTALANFAQRLKALQEVQTGDQATLDRLTRELLASVTEANVEDIVLSLSPAELDTPFGLAALRIWMHAEPAKAAAWIGSLPVMPSEHVWLVAAELARDSTELERFAAGAPAGAWKTAVLHHAGRELADREPLRALNLGLALPEGPKRDDLVDTAFYSWSCNEPYSADAWLAGRQDLPARDRLLALGAKALARKDPVAGSGRLFSSVRDPAMLEVYAPVILGAWVAKNAPAAAGWVENLPKGLPRDIAIRVVAERWSRSDEVAASAWLRTNPVGSSSTSGSALEVSNAK